MEYIEIIKKVHKDYINNDNYVFKSCGGYIVILKKTEDTLTNQERIVVDDKFAKYRANKLMVIKIFNKLRPSSCIPEIFNTVSQTRLKYVVGTMVVSDYNDDINIVCGSGIHYFKSVEAAFYYYLMEFHNKYSGVHFEFFDDGTKMTSRQFFNGIVYGTVMIYCKNGSVSITFNVLNGKKHGLEIFYYENSVIHKTCNYVNNKKNGYEIFYNIDGTIEKKIEHSRYKLISDKSKKLKI